MAKPADTGGACGGEVSIVTVSGDETALLPVPSLSTAVRTCTPAPRPGTKAHPPEGATMPLWWVSTPPSNSLTVSPASPLPMISGVVLLVRLSPATPLSDSGDSASAGGAGGGGGGGATVMRVPPVLSGFSAKAGLA
jgi:hypothetical protein